MVGLGVKWMLSFCLLIVPIAITLGVLFPIQSRHRATGHAGSVLGNPGLNGDGGPTRTTPKDNNVELKRSCKQFDGLGDELTGTFWAKGQTQYILNPNQWGLTDGAQSGMCMDVLFNNNGSYGDSNRNPKDLAPPFQVTWKYPPAPAGQNNVHAFPNIKANSLFPKQFSDIKSLYVDFEWKYVVGNDNATASASSQLQALNVNTNVAIDMFADGTKSVSSDNAKAAWEIMVWFAQIGPAAQPIGQHNTSIIHTITLTDMTTQAKVDFDLWADHHPTTPQFVMTWKARSITEKFHGDIYPLVEYVLSTGNSTFPSSSDFLGSFGMGSEAYDSPQNVTFYCPDFAVKLG